MPPTPNVQRNRHIMKNYRWTIRIASTGAALIAAITIFVIVVRVLGTPIAGIKPEALVLTAMMTAPFTIGAVLVSTGTAALTEKVCRRKHRANA